MTITSPTGNWVAGAFANCENTLLIASPYVGSYINKAISKVGACVKIRMLTRTLLTDFASYASDLEAVYEIAKRNGGVLSLSSLHAKVYVVDRSVALVTSANATASGMLRNRECGVEITTRGDIDLLSELILSGFGASPKPKYWTPEELAALREPVIALRSALPQEKLRKPRPVEAPSRIVLDKRQFHRLLETFAGWTRLAAEGIASIQHDEFTMEQVFTACSPLAAVQFPGNRHVREKLRQQLQKLRDLGLVSFLGQGRYELLARMR